MTGPPSLKRLGEEMRIARSTIASLAAELRALETQSAQLAALREDEVALAARLEQLEQSLMPARVAAHCREAIRRAPLVNAPVAHAVIADLLPPDAYTAIIDALPSPAFFEGRDDTRRQVEVPPKLAETHATVAWRFVAGLVVDAIAPALVERFAAPLLREVQRFAPAATAWPVAGHGVAPSLGRILRREHGATMQSRRERPRHFLTSVLFLARPGDTAEYGSVLRHDDRMMRVPFAANTLLTMVDVAGVHDYEPIPADAPQEIARYTYEFPIGPQGWDPSRLGRLDS